jgi:hypothetical protein
MQRKDNMNAHSSSVKRFGLVAAVAGALFLVPSASSQNGPQYADGTGDGGSAGDIGGVTVLGDKTSGQLVFRVTGSGLSTSPSTVTMLFIDSDANPNTGNANWSGADYLLGVDDSTFDLLRWDGSDWLEAPYSTVRVCCIGGGSTVTFSVNRSELGNTSEFNFMARSRNIDTDANDDAPDDGMYNYSLDAGGPDIQGVTLQTAPASGPRAGKPFVVTPIALKLPPNGAILPLQPKPESYACRASMKGRPVAGSGAGGCTIRVAKKKTRGKKLIVLVSVTYQGATKSVPFTFVVS